MENQKVITEQDLEYVMGSYAKQFNVKRLTKFINESLANVDEEAVREISDRMVSQWTVLMSGRYKMEDYVAAVKYTSYKLMGYSNIEAYRLTFPDRYERVRKKLINEGIEDEGTIRDRLSPYVSIYNQGELVNKIAEQTLIPDHIINVPVRQKAILKLVDLMDDPNASKAVQQRAAEALFTGLKPPEVAKIELDMRTHDNDIIMQLQKAVHDLSYEQKKVLEMGLAKTTDIAQADIITVEADTE